ncbi:permease [Metabacillus sp. RGM 3146]|uniref:permease n=1 Tax=Metabacillus sp. RGM 3146 TaxID=3401092 RepID=UPI003B9C9876
MNTIFISIVLEAIPFILIGVIFSSIIQIYVSERMIQRFMPRRAYMAMIPAACLGIIFPICECAIIPVVSRLIKKGMPPAAGIVFMLSGPIINPVVYASTYFAFQNKPQLANERMLLAFIASIVISGVLFRFFYKQDPIKKEGQAAIHHEHHHSETNKWKELVYHVSDEFFDTGKYLIIGSILAALFQTVLNRNILTDIGANDFLGPAVMIGLGYILSVCSQADAFVASSFSLISVMDRF